jgi:hypothetical protein
MKKPVPGEARKSAVDIIKPRYAFLEHRAQEAVLPKYDFKSHPYPEPQPYACIASHRPSRETRTRQ